MQRVVHGTAFHPGSTALVQHVEQVDHGQLHDQSKTRDRHEALWSQLRGCRAADGSNPLQASLSPLPSPAPLRVNINTAPVSELDRLPGVGPVTAQRIVAFREQNGPFETIEQLRSANLVNASTFEKIKDLIDR